MTQPVNAIWIGKQMGAIHAACLRSFLDCGHDVFLHSYGKIDDAPKGVTYVDARKLMLESEIVRHRKSGSLALASDIYRYRIMKAGMGTYVDCDVLCIKPLPDDDFLFGREDDRRLGSAVLRFPAESPALAELVTSADNPNFIPPWGKPAKRIYLTTRKRLGIPVSTSSQRWGSIGPDLVTHVVNAHKLANEIRPIDAFYPVHYFHTALFDDPAICLADLITKRTHTVHLWHNRLPKGDFTTGGILDTLAKGFSS